MFLAGLLQDDRPRRNRDNSHPVRLSTRREPHGENHLTTDHPGHNRHDVVV